MRTTYTVLVWDTSSSEEFPKFLGWLNNHGKVNEKMPVHYICEKHYRKAMGGYKQDMIAFEILKITEETLCLVHQNSERDKAQEEYKKEVVEQIMNILGEKE